MVSVIYIIKEKFKNMDAQQDILIYVDENDKAEARSIAKSFAENDVKNRAYYNILGAQLAGKYLASEGIAMSPVDNLHNIRKVLEELDISDVILPRTHIDVRVVFDDKYIFVPKSHFELKITPHIYLVLQMSNDQTHVKFLGFFEPDAINQENQNDQYYFIDKSELMPTEKLYSYLDAAKTSTVTELSEEELQNFEESIINMVDNDIELLEKKILLKVLTKSQELRNKFIEFENFELISYRLTTEYGLEENIQEAEVPEEQPLQEQNDSEQFTQNEFEVFESTDEFFENLSQTEDVNSEKMYNDIDGEKYSDTNDESKD